MQAGIKATKLYVADSYSRRWGVILAGGDGRRLLPLTRRIAGDDRPKQFCAIMDGETLLEQTRCKSFPDAQAVADHASVDKETRVLLCR